MTSPNDPLFVEIAGLKIPAPLLVRIIAALRNMYPMVTEGLPDEDVIPTVLKWVFEATLGTYEGYLIEQEVDKQIEDLREARRIKVQKAHEKAKADAALVEKVISFKLRPEYPEKGSP